MTANDLKMINVCWQKLTYKHTHTHADSYIRHSETRKPDISPQSLSAKNHQEKKMIIIITHTHQKRWFMVFQMYITIIRHINERPSSLTQWQSMSQVKLYLSYAFKSLVNGKLNWFYISVWLLASFWLVPKRITKTTKDQKRG